MDFTEFQKLHAASRGLPHGSSKFKALVDSMELNIPVLVPTELMGRSKTLQKTASNVQTYARKQGKQVLRVTNGDEQWVCWVGPFVPKPKNTTTTGDSK